MLMSETGSAARGQRGGKDGGPQKLDIQTLKPGDIIEGRYKYVERIGKGAFGTVLLMEDTVVDERLDPQVPESERLAKTKRS